MRQFHFCNIWRELDRYSRWEIEHLRSRSLSEQLDLIVVGRFVMEPTTYALLARGADSAELESHREARRAQGLGWYSPALQVRCAAGSSYAEKFIRQRNSYLAEKPAILRALQKVKNGSDVIALFNGRIYDVGPFRAYEMATSLTYSEHLNLEEDDLFNVGPGAIGGLELLTGRRSSERLDFELLRDRVRVDLRDDKSFRWIPIEFQGQGNSLLRAKKKFTLRTLEDSLCEFRKYVALGGAGEEVAKVIGAKRRLYRPDI